MQDGDSTSDLDQGLIGAATPIKDVVYALTRRGCPDLTSEIDSASCSALPIDGGGCCDVYRGEMVGGKKIAIKSLRIYGRPGKDNDRGKVLKRAARELYSWSKLEHTNVLPLMGLAMFRGQMSIISEWIENGNLMSYVRLNPDANRVDLSLDVCMGLTYLHSVDMVHGDLKAANVMVSQSGTAMLADFGNSQLKNITLHFTGTTNPSLSLRWAAPELLKEDNGPQLTKKADVYACGMTILAQEVLTGKVPYDECSDEQVVYLVAFGQETPTRPAFGLSDEIWEILQRCWKPSPERPEIAEIKGQLVQLRVPPERMLDNQGHSKEAEMIGTSEQVPGESHPDGVPPGRMVDNQDQSKEAETLGTSLLNAREEVLGGHHPDTLQSKANLTASFSKRGHMIEAELLRADPVATYKRTLVEGHPDTLKATSILSTIYRNQGRRAEAEVTLVTVPAVQERLFGNDRPGTLQSAAHLTTIYSQQVRLWDAKRLKVKLVAIKKRVFGGFFFNHDV